MDSGDMEKFAAEKRNDDPSSYRHSPGLSSGWANLKNTSMGINTPTREENHPMAPTTGDLNLFGSSSCSSASIVDPYFPNRWDHPTTSHSQPLGNIYTQNSDAGPSNALGFRKAVPSFQRTSTDHLGWNPLTGDGMFVSSVLGILPQSLSQPSTNSAFIDRARLSCLSGYAGSSSDVVDHFGASELISPFSQASRGIVHGAPHEAFVDAALRTAFSGQSQKNEASLTETPRNVSFPVEHGRTEGSPFKNERRCDEAKEGVGVASEESDEANFSRGGDEASMSEGMEPSAEGAGTKKPKRNRQEAELAHAKGTLQRQRISEPILCHTNVKLKVSQNRNSSASKYVVNQSAHGSQASNPPREEYIHVRARRGQATNSHSLAERVRREKISERMKFLQDLVPGCRKVTGKAVMLDEIINYVESLQRQVEFLSMKLATINPQLDLNIEGLLAKDFLSSRAGPSSVPWFSPDMSMAYPQPPLSESGGLIHAGLNTMARPPDALRRTMSAHLTGISGRSKEPTQVPNVWEDELHNVVQTTFSMDDAPSNSQHVDGSLPRRTKAEP